MGQRAVCFSQESVCLKILNRGQVTHANRIRHTTSSSTFCRVLPGVRSVAKSELPWPRTRVAPVPHGPAIFLRRHSSAPLLGVLFFQFVFPNVLRSAQRSGARWELTCSPRAFSSPPQSTMLRLVLALCVAAASGTLRLRVVAPARAAETSLPPLWRRTMGAAGGGCGDCAQRGCSIELRTRRRAASSSAGG